MIDSPCGLKGMFSMLYFIYLFKIKKDVIAKKESWYETVACFILNTVVTKADLKLEVPNVEIWGV